jgi:hypothetical protein
MEHDASSAYDKPSAGDQRKPRPKIKVKAHRPRVQVRKHSIPDRPRKMTAGPPWKAVLALVVGLLVVAALLLDLRGLTDRQALASDLPDTDTELQNLALEMNLKTFEDPAGHYRLRIPASWRVATGAYSEPYSAVFTSPNGPDLRVMATPGRHRTFRDLFADIEEIQKRFGVDMHIRSASFQGRPAVERDAVLHGLRIYFLDFMEDGVTHHLQFSAHPDLYEQYFPPVRDLIETYQPLPRPDSDPGEART